MTHQSVLIACLFYVGELLTSRHLARCTIVVSAAHSPLDKSSRRLWSAPLLQTVRRSLARNTHSSQISNTGVSSPVKSSHLPPDIRDLNLALPHRDPTLLVSRMQIRQFNHKPNRAVQSNLRTGCVATPCGRPTQPPHTIVQPYLPGGANVHANLIHDSFGPSHSPYQTASRSSQPF